MVTRTLPVSFRPRKFSEVIGQDSVLAVIRNQYKSEREPSAWLLVGTTGTGKTTLARILALSLNCTHQKEFGEPCQECYENRFGFSIREINASEVNGVEKIAQIAESSTYQPLPPSRRNVFILDEAQRLSKESQNLLLKYFEEAPETTVWIICTTEKAKIIEPLQRRCEVLKVKRLQADDIELLVKRAIAFAKGGKPPEPIAVALCNAQIQSPGLILKAVERYLAGVKSKEAVKNLVTGVDSIAICRALETGDWNIIRTEIKDLEADDLKGIRAQVAGYLKEALLKKVISPKAAELARAIELVAKVDSLTDVCQGPATVAALYELTQLFRGPEQEVDKPF